MDIQNPTGAQYKAVTFDPKTALEHCETLMLDMDGTILDLAYDNYMWMTHVPSHWGEQNGMSLSEARSTCSLKFGGCRVICSGIASITGASAWAWMSCSCIATTTSDRLPAGSARVPAAMRDAHVRCCW